MLTKLLTCSEPVRVLLLSDPSVFDAQVKAARAAVEADLGDPAEGIVRTLLDVIAATTGGDANSVLAISSARATLEGFVQSVVPDDEKQPVLDRFTEAMRDEDVRQAMAYVRAQTACNMYRESVDVNDLLDADPDGATWITVRALSREQMRAADRFAGVKSRLGAILYAQCIDKARQEGRQGNDAAVGYARHLASFTDDERAEIEKFEGWQERCDEKIAAMGIITVDGFDLEIDAATGEYPTGQLVEQVLQGREVVNEIARHIRQVSTLGKIPSLSLGQQSGTAESESVAAQLPTGGSATSAQAAAQNLPLTD
jgi:hypothetical protein